MDLFTRYILISLFEWVCVEDIQHQINNKQEKWCKGIQNNIFINVLNDHIRQTLYVIVTV